MILTVIAESQLNWVKCFLQEVISLCDLFILDFESIPDIYLFLRSSEINDSLVHVFVTLNKFIVRYDYR